MWIYNSDIDELNCVIHSGRAHDKLLYLHVIPCTSEIYFCILSLNALPFKNFTSQRVSSFFLYRFIVIKETIVFTLPTLNKILHIHIHMTLSHYMYVYHTFSCGALTPRFLSYPSRVPSVPLDSVFN